jgi:hypothetical protein
MPTRRSRSTSTATCFRARGNPIGDRLASLVFGNKMETAGDLEIQLELPEVENLSQSGT